MARSRMLGAVLLVLGVCAFLAFLLRPASAPNRLWGLEFESSVESDKVRFLAHESGNRRIEVTEISDLTADAAARIVDEKVSLYAALFEKQRVGYAGQQTEYIDCADEYKPQLLHRDMEAGELSWFSGFASARYTTGVCLQADIAYRSLNIYLVCHDGPTVYDIGFFSALDDELSPQAFLDSLSCED